MKNIILTGYMGCGKTTVGQRLAERIGYVFADTDGLIEKEQGRSISDIFAQDGEQTFRAMETALLNKALCDGKDGLVIATGGGLPVRAENRELIKRLGTVVYLRVKPETVYERVKGDTSRPLLQCENPLERIKGMLLQRSPAYETADFIIDADSLSPEEAAAEIEECLKWKGSAKS
ncbi:MAG: shikimate kinase [Lachnospiraceae bacterium]|nr:shikimate kinase [Lachnospiraceae bacterium]